MDDFYNNCVFINEQNNLLSNFDRSVEDGTRYLIKKYVTPDMKVLELGSRYGTVSVCLDFLLNDPKTQLVCVEPDVNVIDKLIYNRNINKCQFNIFNGAISNKELYVCWNGCGWETKTYIIPPPNLKHEKINTETIDNIEKMYKITFDCLLADCEGFLLQFIEENPSFFDRLKCVIYEEDCGINHPINGEYIDYNLVESFLVSKGFTLVETYLDKIGLNNKVYVNFHSGVH